MLEEAQLAGQQRNTRSNESQPLHRTSYRTGWNNAWERHMNQENIQAHPEIPCKVPVGHLWIQAVAR
jgi:hypothetical protein